MELMDASLDKFYKFIFERLDSQIPEEVIGKITVAVRNLKCDLISDNNSKNLNRLLKRSTT
jgi:hypothetical protein